MRDDIVTLFRSLDLRAVLLVGHSRGGGVSLLTAAALPERIRGVMSYEPTIPFRPDLPPLPAGSPAPPITARMSARRGAADGLPPAGRRCSITGRTRDAFRRWREEYLRAFVEHGSVERADGTVELACRRGLEARMYE